MNNKTMKNKIEYNANWTKVNTKNINIRFNKNDEIWKFIDILKEKNIKLNAIFKKAIIEEIKKINSDI